MSGLYIDGLQMPTDEQGLRVVHIYADGVVTNYAEDIIGHVVPVQGDLMDRNALLGKVVEIQTDKWEGHHFEKTVVRAIREEDVLSFPAGEREV